MADEQEMIRRLLSNSVSGIISKLTSETLTFGRIDSLQYRVDWLYHTTVRYLVSGIIDARIVRCLREAREFLYRSRSGGLSTSCQAQQIFTGARGRLVKKWLNCLVSAIGLSRLRWKNCQKVLTLVLDFYKKCLKFRDSAQKLLAVTFF